MTDDPYRWIDDPGSSLGRLVRHSNRNRADVSDSQRIAAENLLRKACRALRDHDEKQARYFVGRASRLGHDDHEDVDVTSSSAHMVLFMQVTDCLEESDDERWLDAAEAVLADAGDVGRRELLDVLATCEHDYDLMPGERLRVRRHLHPGRRPSPLAEGLQVDVDTILQLLATVVAYESAVGSVTGSTP